MRMQLAYADLVKKGGSCFEGENGPPEAAQSPRSVAGGLSCLSDANSRSSWDSTSGESCCRNNVCRSVFEGHSVVPAGRDQHNVERTVRYLDFDQISTSKPELKAEKSASQISGITENATDKVPHSPSAGDFRAPSFGRELLDPVLPSADQRGLQQKISELRIALQASDRARQEGEKETESLRRYLANVEAGASSLHMRMQELEQQLQLAKAHDERDLGQLQDKIVADARQEAQSHAAAAAQAVVVAREATMEVDKSRRQFSAVVKSQEDEVRRLCKELGNTRILYQARSGQVEALKEQIQELERSLYAQTEKADAALKDSKVDVPDLQNKIETLQLVAKQKEAECCKLQEALDKANKKAKALESRIHDLESEKTDLKVQNDCLEQQVNELQNRQVMATIAHYDCELRKVRAVLGGEKAHLLSELALLRCRNKSLRGDLAEWQQKYKALSHHVSGLEGAENSEYRLIENPLWESGKHKDLREADGQLKQNSAAGKELERPEATDYQNNKATDTNKDKINGNDKGNAKDNDKTYSSVQNKKGDGGDLNRSSQDRERICSKGCCCCTCETRDNILAAAHREILKLNEINQWLLAACHSDKKAQKLTVDNKLQKFTGLL